MSPTIRVTPEVREAIESFQGSEQTLGEAVEQMAEELGLFGERRVADFRDKLSGEYGFDDTQISEIETALRILYTRQVEPSFTVPEEAIDDLKDEVNILERFDLVSEESGSYSMTDAGTLIASAITEEKFQQRTDLYNQLLANRHELLLAFLIEFGFNKTRDHHLGTNLSPLSQRKIKDVWWEQNEVIQSEYESLKTQLLDADVAIRNEFQQTQAEEDPIVLPPDFEPVLAEFSPELRSALEHMECYRTILRFAEDEPKASTRERMIQTLQIASEETLKQVVNELHEDGLTSRYTENETPFLVKDTDGIRLKIRDRLKEVDNEI